MKYIVSAFVRILGVLSMLMFFAGPLHADPVITLVEGGDNPIDVFAVNTSLGAFVIDNNGRLRVTFRNRTSFTFQDLHISFSPPVNIPINADGGSIFDVSIVRPGGVDFFVRTSGTGIRSGRTITIIFENFPPGTRVTEITNTIPEPATLILLGTGVAGVAVKVRKKLKHRKSSRIPTNAVAGVDKNPLLR